MIHIEPRIPQIKIDPEQSDKVFIVRADILGVNKDEIRVVSGDRVFVARDVLELE